MKELEEEHKNAIDALVKSKARRKKPPLKEPFTVLTIPGDLPFRLVEAPLVWETMDEDIPQSEARWDFEHLMLVNGSEGLYKIEMRSTKGESGTKDFKAFVYGNLGESRMYVNVCGVNAVDSLLIQSDGLTEEKAVALMETRFKYSLADAEERKLKLQRLEKVVLGLVGVITIGGIALAVAGVIGAALLSSILAVAAVVGIVVAVMFILIEEIFFSEEPIIKSIREIYPSGVKT